MSATEIHCNSCTTVKPVSEFYPYCIYTNGVTGKCKACREATRKAWHAANPGLATFYTKRKRERNPEKARQLAKDIYQRMKARGTRGKKRTTAP
jgi:hypothetical protein